MFHRAMILGTLFMIVSASNALADAPSTQPAAKFEVSALQKKGGFDSYIITSDYQEKPAAIYVLLPDKFDKSRQYKVLYVLPAWAPSNDGLKEARKLDLANKFNIICVNPDYNPMPLNGPWYGDNPDNPKIRYDSYMPDIVVPFIDKTYPTIAKAEGRLLVGFSKSGLGAVDLLLRHPDIFGRAGAWDAALGTAGEHPEFFGPKDNFMQNYYVPEMLKRRQDILKDHLARIAIAGHGFGSSLTTHKVMDDLQIPHYYNETLGGTHAWNSGWLGPLTEVLMSPDMAAAQPDIAPATGANGASH